MSAKIKFSEMYDIGGKVAHLPVYYTEGLEVQKNQPFFCEFKVYFRYGDKEYAAALSLDETMTSDKMVEYGCSLIQAALRTMHKKDILKTEQNNCDCFRCRVENDYTDYIRISGLL